MELNDHEEQEEEEGVLRASASYDALGNSSRAKIASTEIDSVDAAGSHRKPATRYRECLKNHAVDGCGEFMPAREEGSLDALKCASCNCHRNFHRKETDGGSGGGGGEGFHHDHHQPYHPHLTPERIRERSMELEDHEEQEEEEMVLRASASYDALCNSSRAKIASTGIDSVDAAASHRRPATRYRECLKNHAVGIGGQAVDGCGEFMPAGEEGSLDALKCAACNCHRNFHRRVTDGGSGRGGGEGFHHDHHQPYHPHLAPYYRTPYLHMARPLALPSTSGGAAHSRGDDQEDVSNNPSPTGGTAATKRFLTKFTQEQKEKMLAFAGRVGWRIRKQDEAAVQHFCEEAGINRHVLKVWMDNNKNSGKKANPNPDPNPPS